MKKDVKLMVCYKWQKLVSQIIIFMSSKPLPETICFNFNKGEIYGYNIIKVSR